jgi:response regulator RpfG family c-di-GMP phosphodiesterase
MNQTQATASAAQAKVPTILFVDDEANILASLRRLFRGKGFDVRMAESGKAGLELLESEPVDLVISDMRMPEMDGTQLLEQVRARWPDTVRLLLTGYSDVTSIIGAVNRGEIYRYITKPWDDNEIVLIVRQALDRQALEREKKRLEALTVHQNEELKLLNASLEARVEARTGELRVANESLQGANDKLKNSFITSLKVFSTLMEMRGGSLAGHSRRVADLSRRIARKLQLDDNEVQEVFIAGLLHEIGKVGFADELLAKPVAMMSQAQLDAYRKHTAQAEQLLLPLSDLRNASELICAQFEHFDGSGFPGGLSGRDIPMGARILSVASDYDNMQIGTLTQHHLSAEESRTIIVHGSGQRYDPQVVAAFVALLGGPVREVQVRPGEASVMASELRAGMVLSRDLIAPSGLLMLSAKHVLDDRLIRKIINFGKAGGLQLSAYIRLDRVG